MEKTPKQRKINIFVAVYVAFFAALTLCGYLLLDKEDEGKSLSTAIPRYFISDVTYYRLPRVSVSTVGGAGGNSPQRVSAAVSLEVSRKDAYILEGYEPHILEQVNKVLENVDPRQLTDADYLPKLRADLLKAVNSVGSPVPVHDLLFRELVVM